MSGRPSYVHCALTGMHGGEPPKPLRETWCGRPPVGFVFVDASHALIEGRRKGRLQLCSRCAKAMRKALAEVTWEP